MSARALARLGLLAGWLALAAAVLALLAIWQGQAYWEYSDGVYSVSARQLLDGQSLYRDFAAAQPPPVYYVGAAALAIDDSPTAIRVAMAVCEACVSLLVLVAVRRLAGSSVVALAASAASFVTPWALREHAQLLPETLAAPIILGAALAAGRRGGDVLAGALGALAASVKLAFVIPAAAVVLTARSARRAASGLVVGGLILAGLGLLIFGRPLWTQAVRAQAETGLAPVAYVAGLSLQAAWNDMPILLLAAVAWRQRAALKDPELARSLAAAGLGSLLLVATLFKHGSYLTVMVVAEPPLLCLAAAGLARAWGEPGRSAGSPARRRALASVGALALWTAQATSLLLSPATPRLFTRPLAASGPAQVLSSARVGALAAGIRRCPPATVYAGPPYLAFVAGRGVAGAQPDQFIIRHAPVLAGFRRRAETDASICRTAPSP